VNVLCELNEVLLLIIHQVMVISSINIFCHLTEYFKWHQTKKQSLLGQFLVGWCPCIVLDYIAVSRASCHIEDGARGTCIR
jgi:hypothetical protein